MRKEKKKIKIAAIGDLHVGETDEKELRVSIAKASATSDVILLCGDLTNLGLEREVDSLIAILEKNKIPILGVLGNHDYESGKETYVRQKLEESGIKILDGTNYILNVRGKRIGFTGVKGFGGGFNPYMWGRFGELEQKSFYDAIDSELRKLEVGLDALRQDETDKVFVLLHYSPIRETVVGEIAELFPFLGSSRIEELINRYEIDAIFHGHSHFGSMEGKTGTGIPVYNVALPLLRKNKFNPPVKFISWGI